MKKKIRVHSLTSSYLKLNKTKHAPPSSPSSEPSTRARCHITARKLCLVLPMGFWGGNYYSHFAAENIFPEFNQRVVPEPELRVSCPWGLRSNHYTLLYRPSETAYFTRWDIQMTAILSSGSWCLLFMPLIKDEIYNSWILKWRMSRAKGQKE